ncbi:MAG: RNA recognition motif-containing [Trebouxia sp. A1-2]|nr:MAG: RNA recognition motif-containing [Trebouxia sp. A1-2]
MPGKHRLYLHCPGLCEDQLYMYLQQFGRVTDVYLPKGLDGQSKGYGFASFETADALSAALDAGEEHSIRGKTVRVNRAGPRPALHLSAANSDPGRQGISHVSSAPMSGGVSRQRGGHSTSEPSTSSTRLQNLGSAAGTDNNGSGASESGLRSAVPQGAGPRIYVGGISNAVSETMVRKYFSNWGKVEDVYFPKERASGRRRPFCFVTFASQKAAEKAVAQSNREISGYQVASISMTADRVAHYQQVAGGGEEIQRMFQDIEPAHPFALSLQGLLPQLAAVQAQQAGLPALAADNIVLEHQQGLPTLSVDDALGPLMGLAVGQHPPSGPPGSFGHMLSYNSCPSDINSVFRAQLGARQHGLGLTQMVGQANPSGQTQGFNHQSGTPPSQEFNPTVGSHRPEDFGPGAMEEHFGVRHQ